MELSPWLKVYKWSLAGSRLYIENFSGAININQKGVSNYLEQAQVFALESNVVGQLNDKYEGQIRWRRG